MAKREMTTIDLEAVERQAKRGLTDVEIMDALALSREDLKSAGQWDQFERAIRSGRARGVGDVADALYESALSGKVSAQLFYLKMAAGWGERKRDGETEDMFRPEPKEAILSRIRAILAKDGADAGGGGSDGG